MSFFLRMYPGDDLALLGLPVAAQCAAVVLLALMISRTWARRDPAARYGLWLCALACIALGPLVAWAFHAGGVSLVRVPVPQWEGASSATSSNLFPGAKPGHAERTNALQVEAAASRATGDAAAGGSLEVSIGDRPKGSTDTSSTTTPAAVASTNSEARGQQPARPEAAMPRPAARASGSSEPVAAPAPVAPARVAPPPVAVPPVTPAPKTSAADRVRAVLGFLVCLWLAGAAFLLARLAWGWRWLSKLRRQAVPVDDHSIAAVAASVRQALGVDSLPPIMTCARVGSPITIGFSRAAVLLPDRLIEMLDARQLREILIHEAAHILRRDHAVGLIQRLVQICLWPHPAIYTLNRELVRARERRSATTTYSRTARRRRTRARSWPCRK